jgi:hypothetical protein
MPVSAAQHREAHQLQENKAKESKVPNCTATNLLLLLMLCNNVVQLLKRIDIPVFILCIHLDQYQALGCMININRGSLG